MGDPSETTLPTLLLSIPEQPKTALTTRAHPSFSEMMKEARQLYAIAFPLILTGLLTYGKSCISTFFLGRIGKDALAGGSTAVAFANVTGYSCLTGLAMGMDAICSQAIGAEKWHKVGQALQRTTLILFLFCLPFSALWISAYPILTMILHQNPSTSALTTTYLRWCVPDLFISAAIFTLRIYLRTQNITRPLTVSAGVSLLLHAPLNYLFAERLEYGIKGVALCVVLNDLNQLMIILIYLYMTGLHKKTWGRGWSMDCLRKWGPILRHALPNCLSVCLEWWWYEAMTIISGTFPNHEEAVATMGILIQATSLIYIFPSSLSNAVSTRVGNELGAGSPLVARTSAMVAFVCAVFKGVGAFALVTGFKGAWGKVFSHDELILKLTATVMPWLGLCELGNCPQTTLCGVLRGSARTKLGAAINLGAFYIVGLPIAWIVGCRLRKGLIGLWMGLFAAQMACTLLMGIVMVRTNWELEAKRAKELVAARENAEEDDDDDGGEGAENASVSPVMPVEEV